MPKVIPRYSVTGPSLHILLELGCPKPVTVYRYGPTSATKRVNTISESAGHIPLNTAQSTLLYL